MISFRGVAHPWLCDINGHLNVRHYHAFFDEAAWHLLGACGFHPAGAAAQGVGVVDVCSTTQFKAEVRPGELVYIESGFTALGGKSFDVRHKLFASADGRAAAVGEIKSVFFDLTVRRAIEIPPAFRAAAGGLMAEAAKT